MPSRTLIRVVIACLLATVAPVRAQVDLFQDDEARARQVELTERLDQLEIDLRRLSHSGSSLTADKQEILALVRELSGLLEDTNATAARQASQINELDRDLDSKLTTAVQQLEGKIQGLAATMVNNADKLYARALQARNQNQAPRATTLLRDLLHRFPDSKFVPAARYWLGQLAHDAGNFDNAEDELVALLAGHPDHARIPDAISLLHAIAVQRGSVAEQKHWQQQLLKKHPASAAADRLRIELDAGGG